VVADDSGQPDLGGKGRREPETSDNYESETDKAILFIYHGMSLLKSMNIEAQNDRPGWTLVKKRAGG
jgi:hypothetical protein